MTTVTLKNKTLVVRSEKLPDTPKPVPWRAFNRFAADVERLLDYLDELLGNATGDGEFTSSGVADDAEWFTELVAKVRAGFARFDHEENYEVDDDDDEGERVLKSSHIAKRLSVLAVSFPAGTPGSPEGYLKMLVEHVSAVDGLSGPALEAACREIVETKKFLPAASEVLEILKQHVSRWRIRRFMLREAEGRRQVALKALRAREAEKEKQEHERQVQMAISAAKFAMQATQNWADQIKAKKAEIETKQAELAKLLQRHAEAENRESELLRKLRQVSMPPEEAEAAEAEAAAKYNGSGAKLL